MGSEGGPADVVVEALGVAVGIPVTGSAAVRLRRQWSRALTERDPVTVIDLTYLDPDDVVAHDYAITTLVTRAALDATAGLRVNLHAGAVADGRGRALALIGPSGSGKTTAISMLAGRLGYLSDETVSLDDDLLVHAHPKPLSVITDVDEPRMKQSVSPDEVDLLRPPERAHLHRIVLLHRGTADTGPAPMSTPRAIAEIVEQSSSLVQIEHPIHRLAGIIDACGGAWGLGYDEFADHIDEVIGLLDREPQAPVEHVHHPFTVDAVGPAVPGSWSRAPWADAEEWADELVLMVGSGVHVLAGLGVVLWLALETPHTVDQLVVEVEALWGEHPGAADLVADALAVMAEQELLQPPA